MDDISQETLRRVTENDKTLRVLQIGGQDTDLEWDFNEQNDQDDDYIAMFHSRDSCDFSTLGVAISNNTHLRKLILYARGYIGDNSFTLDLNRRCYNGIKHNSLIREIKLYCCNHTIVDGVGHEMIRLSQENSDHLTYIHIEGANLENGGDHILNSTLRRCINIEGIALPSNGLTDEQILPIVEAIRGHRQLQMLNLHENRIGRDGCEVLATLLEDPNCNVQHLCLYSNQIDNNGAIIIANSLVGNKTLKHLFFGSNPITNGVDVFSGLLCNKSSINSIHMSNHSLETVRLDIGEHDLSRLLGLNKSFYKGNIAIKKILRYHPNIDMAQLFELDLEGEEHTLKGLPHVVAWFERALDAVETLLFDGPNGYDYRVEEKKLSAIYQFALAMPLLFVPASHTKPEKKKRKRK